MAPRVFNETGIHPDAFDGDAVRVVSRLRRKGHEAYLVGGCVRDILLGQTPKDFDIATSARPRQIKSLFRNCRIIGRRFKLAHLHFDGKIIEVSTFRRRPDQEGDDDEDLLILSDNVFGTAHEDALRRDFTINGLFLDPEAITIHDHVSGIEDIQRGVVRTIGDPLVRIKEDPVRILRAVKFAARLGLAIDPATWDAMCKGSSDLSRSAQPRVLEEILRLLRTGNSLLGFQMLRECGALAVLIPELTDFLNDNDSEGRLLFWRMLEALDIELGQDQHSQNGRPGPWASTAVILGALFYNLVEQHKAQPHDAEQNVREVDLGRMTESILGPITKRLNLSRADSGRLKRICVVQRRFNKNEKTKNFRPAIFMRQDYFPEALQLLKMRCHADELSWTAYDSWLARYQHTAEAEGLDDRKGSAEKPSRSRSRSRNTDRDGDGHVQEKKAGTRGRRTRSPEPRTSRSKSSKQGAKKSRGRRQQTSRETMIAPLPTVALDPKEIPTYGSVLGDTGSADKIELESSMGRRARKKQQKQDEPYTPPPPPEQNDASRDSKEPDTFGDW